MFSTNIQTRRFHLLSCRWSHDPFNPSGCYNLLGSIRCRTVGKEVAKWLAIHSVYYCLLSSLCSCKNIGGRLLIAVCNNEDISSYHSLLCTIIKLHVLIERPLSAEMSVF